MDKSTWLWAKKKRKIIELNEIESSSVWWGVIKWLISDSDWWINCSYYCLIQCSSWRMMKNNSIRWNWVELNAGVAYWSHSVVIHDRSHLNYHGVVHSKNRINFQKIKLLRSTFLSVDLSMKAKRPQRRESTVKQTKPTVRIPNRRRRGGRGGGKRRRGRRRRRRIKGGGGGGVIQRPGAG